jgi:hypothetical protein
MIRDERELEDRLRATLSSWALEAPAATDAGEARRPPAPRAVKRWRSGPLFRSSRRPPSSPPVVVIRAEPSAEPVTVGASDLVTADIRVGDRNGVRAIAAGDGAVYVASENDRRLFRVDTATEAVLAGPSLAVPDSVVVGDGAVFAIVDDPPRLARLDPQTMSIQVAVAVPGTPTAVRMVGDRIWVTTTEHELAAVRPADAGGERRRPVPLGSGFQDVGPAGLWRTDLGAATLSRLDEDTGRGRGHVPHRRPTRAVGRG